MAALCIACNTPKQEVTLQVINPLALDRTGEIVEVDMDNLVNQLTPADTEQFIVLNANGEQLPYQITYDGNLIFPATVAASDTAVYTVKVGTPATFDVIACGKQYPERKDDVAWENDLVAFRTYGPALQQTGERAFGYDIWTKYNTTEPVVEARYAAELNQSVSYHVDHGYGMDCYKVGPTLGGGTAALMPDGNIVYPYCYRTQNILDNGPLRFTVQLVYHPLTVKGDTSVVETRLISLDAGSHLNKTIISYEHLSAPTPIATGIVLHEPDGEVKTDAADGYITYVDPTDNTENNNGKIFVGAAFPEKVDEAKVVLFPEKEKKELRGGADGHVLAIANYTPDTHYTYYWGAAWSKADIKTSAEWNRYMADFAQKVRHPLVVCFGK
jgi:hypothetical protein